MKSSQYMLCLLTGALCLLSSVLLIVFSRSIQATQGRLQAQQLEINRGTQSLQIGSKLVQDLAQNSAQFPQLRQLLAKNGINVTFNQQQGQQQAPAPAAAAPAKPAAASVPAKKTSK